MVDHDARSEAEGSVSFLKAVRGVSEELSMAISESAFGGDMPDILLVEDNALHIRLVKSMLADIWPEPNMLRTARRLEKAIEKVRQEKPELILLDLLLPDADGLEAVNALLAEAEEVPIVVLSSHDDDAMALQAVREGAQDYLVKGTIGPEGLGRAIRFAIHRHRVARPAEPAPPVEAVGMSGVAVIDDAGIIRHVHRDVADILGFDTGALVGTAISELVHPNDVDVWTASLAEAVHADPELGLRVRHASGNDLRVRIELTSLVGEDGSRYLMRWYPLPPEGTASSGQYAVVTEWA